MPGGAEAAGDPGFTAATSAAAATSRVDSSPEGATQATWTYRSNPFIRRDVAEIVVVRHGETTWNRENRMQGQTESDLSDVGLLQASMPARYMPIHYMLVLHRLARRPSSPRTSFPSFRLPSAPSPLHPTSSLLPPLSMPYLCLLHALSARQLAARFAGGDLPFTALYSSDLRRAAETAEGVAEAVGMRGEQVVRLPGLRERNLGVLEGLVREEASRKHPEAYGILTSKDWSQPIPVCHSFAASSPPLHHRFCMLPGRPALCLLYPSHAAVVCLRSCF
ncbi:unnamed protein product [Closterium sp. Naga37s-1]|nr:unnamed protein product [Closterium sp. Naga37s-1]